MMATHLQFHYPAAAHPNFRRAPNSIPRPGLIAWITGSAARWYQRRALEELGDRELRDMGISRSQALAEAAKPFWRG
jgi:uncharacterized protein YjiS (DUF1127 family)